MTRVLLPAIGALSLLVGADAAMADSSLRGSTTAQPGFYLDDGSYAPGFPDVMPQWHGDRSTLSDSSKRFFMPDTTAEIAPAKPQRMTTVTRDEYIVLVPIEPQVEVR